MQELHVCPSPLVKHSQEALGHEQLLESPHPVEKCWKKFSDTFWLAVLTPSCVAQQSASSSERNACAFFPLSVFAAPKAEGFLR